MNTSTNTNRQWLLANRPTGTVKEADFRLVESDMPPVGDNQLLIRNTWFPLEPAMRGWITDEPNYLPPVEIGAVMRGMAYGEVVESNREGFAVGDRVTSFANWQEYSVDEGLATKVSADLDPGMVLSVLGMTGLTAYIGLTEIGKPKRGETVVVSGAAGATGSVAAQVAKSLGCRVIGIAGGQEKCAWLTDVAKLDGAIDYRSEDVSARYAELCPDGVDVFYDNVGGPALDNIFDHLALGARIVLCGAIVRFGDDGPAPGPADYWKMIQKRARMEGFVILDHFGRADEVATTLAEMVALGSLIYETDVQHGFENLPNALTRLYSGKNLGKQLLTTEKS